MVSAVSRYPCRLTTAVPHVSLGTGMDGRLLGPLFQVAKCRGWYFVSKRVPKEPKDPKHTRKEGNTADKSGQCDVFLEHGPGHPPDQRSPKTKEHRISNMGNMGLRGLRTLSPSMPSTPPRLLAFLQIHASLNEMVADGAVLFFKSFQGARGFCGFRSFFEVSSYFLVLSLSLPALLVPCRCLIACNPAHQPAQFSRSCLVHVCNKGRDVGESQRQTRVEDNSDWMEDERATALHFDKKRHCHCRSGVSL